MTVVISENLAAADGAKFRNSGWTSQFLTASRHVANLTLSPLATITTNTGAGDSSRPYGGPATDLNHDGWIDMAITNEDTEDVRVFLNTADGSGTFSSFLQPTFPVAYQASPSDVFDFNGDGHTDLVVSSPGGGEVTMMLGLGNGKFGPPQDFNVGGRPYGVVILDADGDGDVDVVNANLANDNLALFRNNGSGVFAQPTLFDGGVSGESSLAAGDMNNDGIMDLVVGSFGSQSVGVLLGNGQGSFAPQAAQMVGQSRGVAIGDVNGDGYLDVTSANGHADNAAILFGAGDGSLSAPIFYDIAAMGSKTNQDVISSDLGDLDGDGDLDWVTSSYSGNWIVLLNDGTGSFDFFQEADASSAAPAPCCLILTTTAISTRRWSTK